MQVPVVGLNHETSLPIEHAVIVVDAIHRVTLRSLALGLSLLALPGQGPTLQAQSALDPTLNALNLLETVAAIRGVRPDKVALHFPVSVRATVTFVDPIWRTIYVQDATGGILVRADHVTDVRLGDRLQITGVTDAGDPLPIVVADRVVKLGTDALPEAVPFVPARALRYADDAQRVDVAGVIQRVDLDTLGHLTAELVAFDGTPFRVTVAGSWQDTLPQSLVNAEVRAAGVLARLVLPESQTRMLHLLVPHRAAITVTRLSTADPFEAFGPSTGPLEHLTPAVAPSRVRARGHVTFSTSTHLFLEGDRGAFRVDLDPGQDVPAVGMEIEASGFVKPGDTPTLRYALLRATGAPPRQLEAAARPLAQLLRDDAAGRLTRTSAFMVESEVKGQEQRLTLVADDVVMTATVPLGSGWPLTIAPGSRVELTGVPERIDAVPPTATRPRVLRLWTRGVDDVQVVSAPSIFSRTAAAAGAGLALALLGAIAWSIYLVARAARHCGPARHAAASRKRSSADSTTS